MLFTLVGWLFYGLIVGFIVRLLHPGEEPQGILWTVGIGVAGSFVGGFLNWVLGFGGSPISPSGFIMGIIGGFIFCFVYTRYLSDSMTSWLPEAEEEAEETEEK